MESSATPAPKIAELFETIECSRCGGTGHYSYNQVDGTRCYGCGGTGVKLTKAGAAAKAAWVAGWKKEVPVTEIKPGDRVAVMHNRRVILRVAESGPDDLNPGRWTLRFEPGQVLGGYGFFTGDMVELPASREEKRLAYQAIRHMSGAIMDWAA